VSVIVLNPGRLEDELRKTGVRVILLDEARLSSFQILKHLAKVLRHLKPDIVHTHRSKENILGSISAKYAGVPSLRTVHGAAEHVAGWRDIRARIIRLLDRYCGRFLQSRIVAVSEDMAAILAQIFPAERISVIENGIDVEELVRTSMQSINRTSAAGMIIGIAGRLVPVKRVDIFIRTAKYLHDTYDGLELDFRVYGDGPLRESLEELARSLDTGSYLHFEGHVDNLAEVLRSLDMLLMTSDHEGLPMILLEAMALQIPVIAHDVGGIGKLLDAGTSGILVEDHSPEGYGIAVHDLATHPEMRSQITRRALHRIQACYTARRNAGDYCAVYEDILHSAGRATPGA
jgi:glycosyltransferase involved in cell wall biosynthesis